MPGLSEGDETLAEENQKMIAGDQKAETAAIAELAITIRADSPELGEKVT